MRCRTLELQSFDVDDPSLSLWPYPGPQSEAQSTTPPPPVNKKCDILSHQLNFNTLRFEGRIRMPERLRSAGFLSMACQPSAIQYLACPWCRPAFVHMPHRLDFLLVALILTPAAYGEEASAIGPLAESCAACHGVHGEGHGVLPALRGRSFGVLSRVLLDYKTGRRQGTVMPRIARGYGDDELVQLARHFARLPVPVH